MYLEKSSDNETSIDVTSSSTCSKYSTASSNSPTPTLDRRHSSCIQQSSSGSNNDLSIDNNNNNDDVDNNDDDNDDDDEFDDALSNQIEKYDLDKSANNSSDQSDELKDYDNGSNVEKLKEKGEQEEEKCLIDTSLVTLKSYPTIPFFAKIEKDECGYGFCVCGNNPVSIHSVRKGSCADIAGLKQGDEIVKINGVNVLELHHNEVVKLLRSNPKVYLHLRRAHSNQSDVVRGDSRNVSMRSLTSNEASILRSQSRRRYKQKHQSNCEVVGSLSNQLIVDETNLIKRRPTLGNQYLETTRSCSPKSSRVEQTDCDANKQEGWIRKYKSSSVVDRIMSNQLPPTNPHTSSLLGSLVQARSSFNRSDRKNRKLMEKRPISTGPDVYNLQKRSSLKDICSLEQLKEFSSSKLAKLYSNRLSFNRIADESKQTNIDDFNMTAESMNTSLPPIGRVMGRNFDEDSDDDMRMSNEITVLSEQFSKAATVLHSPAKCGILLNYLFNQNRNPIPTLFYLVNRYFERSMSTSKELNKDQKRVCLEIYTTFFHKKSPLYIDSKVTIPPMMTWNLNTCSKIYNMVSEQCVECIQDQVTKMAQEIRHGMDTWRPPEPVNLLLNRSRDQELAIFEMCLTGRLESLYQCVMYCADYPTDHQPTLIDNQKQFDWIVNLIRHIPINQLICPNHVAQALINCLVTAFRLFCMPSSTNSDLLDAKEGIHRQSIFAKSFENLAGSALTSTIGSSTGSIGSGLSTAGLNLWTKFSPYCAKIKHRGSFLSSRKTKIAYKNHSLHQITVDRLLNCNICGYLLWGLAPQGFICHHCHLVVHTKCKSNIHDRCTRDGRKTIASLNGQIEINQLANDVAQNDESVTNQLNVPQINRPTSCVEDLENLINEQGKVHQMAYSKDNANGDDPLNQKTADNVNLTDDIDQMNDPRYVKQMKMRFEGSSHDQVNTKQVLQAQASTDTLPNVNLSEIVTELVHTDWSDDPEMVASETFDANAELTKHFPTNTIQTKGPKNDEYIRMLVLLEFYQKIQYMVRYLKQYDYFLIRRWPPEHDKLAKVLSLDRIPQLIDLFRNLVYTIEMSKRPDGNGFGNVADAVLDWLSSNGGANLNTWSCHCQALSCSNMLDSVRHILRDYVRRHPDIVPLVQTRHNKFVLVEGLKQMRILYFNLPLIVSNIAKDLEKKTKLYKSEAKIWQQIYTKLVSLPQTIDDTCMPLVNRINQGLLVSSMDKKDILLRQHTALWPFQDLMLNFPRVLFHYWVVAFAEVTVDGMTVNRAIKVNHDYICERTDMMVVLLHDALMFLVKENDRYVLRLFKAIREQGGTGNSGSATMPAISGTSSNTSSLSSTSSSFSLHSGLSSTIDRSPVGHLSSASFNHATLTSHASTSLSSSNASSTTTLNHASHGGSLTNVVLTSTTNDVGTSTTTTTSTAVSSSPVGTVTSTPSNANAFHPSIVSAMANAAVNVIDRSSGSLKLAPIFPLQNMFTSCGEKSGGDYLLNIVFMDPTVLIRVLFSKESERQKWFTHLRKFNVNTHLMAASTIKQHTPPTSLSINKDLTPKASTVQQNFDPAVGQQQQQQQQTPSPSCSLTPNDLSFDHSPSQDSDFKPHLKSKISHESCRSSAFDSFDLELSHSLVADTVDGDASRNQTDLLKINTTKIRELLNEMRLVVCERHNLTEDDLNKIETSTTIPNNCSNGEMLLYQFKYFNTWFDQLSAILPTMSASQSKMCARSCSTIVNPVSPLPKHCRPKQHSSSSAFPSPSNSSSSVSSLSSPNLYRRYSDRNSAVFIQDHRRLKRTDVLNRSTAELRPSQLSVEDRVSGQYLLLENMTNFAKSILVSMRNLKNHSARSFDLDKSRRNSQLQIDSQSTWYESNGVSTNNETLPYSISHFSQQMPHSLSTTPMAEHLNLPQSLDNRYAAISTKLVEDVLEYSLQLLQNEDIIENTLNSSDIDHNNYNHNGDNGDNVCCITPTHNLPTDNEND